jgi:hypothetical protein
MSNSILRKDYDLPDAAELINTDMPLNTGLELMVYAEHRVSRPSIRIASINTMALKLVDKFQELELSYKGADYPDWRQFVGLDIANQPREHLRTMPRWFTDDNIDRATDIVNTYTQLLNNLDPIELLAHIRSGLESGKELSNYYEIYSFALIMSKYKIISAGPEYHDVLAPIHCTLYSIFSNAVNLTTYMIKELCYWRLHSTLCMFPYELGVLDINAFEKPLDWLIANTALVLK